MATTPSETIRPEKSAETGPGAAVWASASHPWKGTRPALVAELGDRGHEEDGSDPGRHEAVGQAERVGGERDPEGPPPDRDPAPHVVGDHLPAEDARGDAQEDPGRPEQPEQADDERGPP